MLSNPFRFRWLMLGIMGVIYFLACLHRISPTVIARDLINEFGADATALGLMASAYFYLYAAVQPPVGVLSDTIGPRRVVAIFTLIACLGCLIFGLAVNMLMAGIGRALIGIGVGGIFVPGLKIFSNWYRDKEFAGVTGIFLAMGNAGNLSASLPLTYLVLLLGWRLSFVSIGAISFLLAIIGWIILRDRPEDKGWQPMVELDHEVSPTGESLAPEGMNPFKRVAIIFKSPSFWMVTLSTFFAGGTSLTFQGLWAVPYLMDVYNYTRVQAGVLLMMFPVGFIIGSPLVGFLADRLNIGRKNILLITLGTTVVCWCIIFFSGGKPNSTLFIPMFIMIGLCSGGSLSLYMTTMKELFPPWLTGTAIGLMNPAAFFAAALYQPFTGFIMDRVGNTGSVYPVEAYQQVFTVFLISVILSFVSIIPLKILRK